MTTKQIQLLLTYLEYDPGPIDGLDGANTRDAVKAFQRAEGLTVDGVAGVQTEKALLDAVTNGRVYKPPDGAGRGDNVEAVGDAASISALMAATTFPGAWRCG